MDVVELYIVGEASFILYLEVGYVDVVELYIVGEVWIYAFCIM